MQEQVKLINFYSTTRSAAEGMSPGPGDYVAYPTCPAPCSLLLLHLPSQRPHGQSWGAGVSRSLCLTPAEQSRGNRGDAQKPTCIELRKATQNSEHFFTGSVGFAEISGWRFWKVIKRQKQVSGQLLLSAQTE